MQILDQANQTLYSELAERALDASFVWSPCMVITKADIVFA